MTTSGAPPEASEAVTIYDWKDLGSVEDSVPAVARRCPTGEGREGSGQIRQPGLERSWLTSAENMHHSPQL